MRKGISEFISRDIGVSKATEVGGDSAISLGCKGSDLAALLVAGLWSLWRRRNAFRPSPFLVTCKLMSFTGTIHCKILVITSVVTVSCMEKS